VDQLAGLNQIAVFYEIVIVKYSMTTMMTTMMITTMIPMTMFMVLSSWQTIHLVHLMNIEQCSAAADPIPIKS